MHKQIIRCNKCLSLPSQEFPCGIRIRTVFKTCLLLGDGLDYFSLYLYIYILYSVFHLRYPSRSAVYLFFLQIFDWWLYQYLYLSELHLMFSLMDKVPNGIEPMLKDLEEHIVSAGLADMVAAAETITTVSLCFLIK